MAALERITIVNLSEDYRTRTLRTGIFEVISGAILIITSNFVIFGIDPDAFSIPFLLAFGVISIGFGVSAIVGGANEWRGLFRYIYYWLVGAGGLVVMLAAFIPTRFVSLHCRLEIAFICDTIPRFILLLVLFLAFLVLKAGSMYFVFMIRQEVDYQVIVVEDACDVPAALALNFGQAPDAQAEVAHRLRLSDEDRDLYETAVKKFNAKPKRAIEYILSSGLAEVLVVSNKRRRRAKSTIDIEEEAASLGLMIDPTTEVKIDSAPNPVDKTALSLLDGIPEELAAGIAQLLCDKRISTIKLGSYIGQGDITASALRKAYLATFDYSNMEFDKALRAFLSRLILPVETEKIDRLIESFARRYHENNPTLFATSDTVYVLAFGLLMLHTDAHNPNLKKEQKMSAQQFIHNLRGIDDGADLPTEYLARLYDGIVSEEMMTDVVKKGYMWKHARPGRGGFTQWQRRYFVLSSERVLYYFASHTDKNPRVIIPLEGLDVLRVEFKGRPFCLLLRDPYQHTVKSAKKTEEGNMETATHESFLLAAESEQERTTWISALKAHIDRNPFYTLIKKKVANVHFDPADTSSPFASPRKGAMIDSSSVGSLRPPSSPIRPDSIDKLRRLSGPSPSASSRSNITRNIDTPPRRLNLDTSKSTLSEVEMSTPHVPLDDDDDADDDDENNDYGLLPLSAITHPKSARLGSATRHSNKSKMAANPTTPTQSNSAATTGSGATTPSQSPLRPENNSNGTSRSETKPLMHSSDAIRDENVSLHDADFL